MPALVRKSQDQFKNSAVASPEYMSRLETLTASKLLAAVIKARHTALPSEKLEYKVRHDFALHSLVPMIKSIAVQVLLTHPPENRALVPNW